MPVPTYIQSPAPHIHAPESVSQQCWKTIFALSLVLAGLVFFFGFDALRLILASLLGGVFAEFTAVLFFQKKVTLKNGHTLLFSLLLVPLISQDLSSQGAFAAAFAGIFFGKEIFGGPGSYVFHPTLVGYAILGTNAPAVFVHPMLGEFKIVIPLLLAVFFLWIQALIDRKTSLIYLFSAVLFLTLHPAGSISGLPWPLLIYSAFFLLSDTVTLPLTSKGRFIFAIGAGLIFFLIQWKSLPTVAITGAFLLMNAFTCRLDLWLRPRSVR